MALKVECFGGPKDGAVMDVEHVTARLVFPALKETDTPRMHAYEWRATAQPSGYYYRGMVRA